MLLAVALTLSAPDHWLSPLQLGSDHEHASAETASAAAHGRHCHGKAATCTDLPVTAISGIAALDQWLGAPVVYTPLYGLARPGALETQDAVEVLTPPPRI
jgi:hypothetical protein